MERQLIICISAFPYDNTKWFHLYQFYSLKYYFRFHKDINVNNLPALGSAPIEISQDVDTFKCMSCDYLFGNLTDLKRHLRTRHHINVQDIQKISDSAGNLSEVQVTISRIAPLKLFSFIFPYRMI